MIQNHDRSWSFHTHEDTIGSGAILEKESVKKNCLPELAATATALLQTIAR
jgi:hypothetical protein